MFSSCLCFSPAARYLVTSSPRDYLRLLVPFLSISSCFSQSMSFPSRKSLPCHLLLCVSFLPVSKLLSSLDNPVLILDNLLLIPVHSLLTVEMAVCDNIISKMLSQLTRRPSPGEAEWYGPGHVSRDFPYVITDLENARSASPLCRDIIDESPEWALITLARFDFGNEVEAVWETYNEYIAHNFFRHWDVCSTSWILATPILSNRAHGSPWLANPK